VVVVAVIRCLTSTAYDHEAVEMEVEPVLDRRAVDLGEQGARCGQPRAVVEVKMILVVVHGRNTLMVGQAPVQPTIKP
jgi:hypothetical protein